MKYKDIIEFEPITEVVKLERSQEDAYKAILVKTFVFSKAYREAIIPLICQTLDFSSAHEGFGIQVVGSYGTGKTHLMSLVSIVAEDIDALKMVQEPEVVPHLSKIAGRFKVLRFELGHSEDLWKIVTFKIEQYLKELDISFSFEGEASYSYQERLRMMMSVFEEKEPDKGFLLVIDEMLAYLKGRSASDKLNSDLQVLQALGQAADGSRFRVIFGVQEKIYESPEFQFAAEMLNKVGDRYRDLTISKEDVAFIVQNRLLKKTEHQKAAIRMRLEPYQKFFTGLHARIEEFVALFPVHPSYFDNFRRIRLKGQREILRTLSERFAHMLEQELPNTEPGFICYDSYWTDISHSSDLMAIPDVRRVREAMEVVEDKIEAYFIAGRASKKPIAKRLAHAAAIKLLQADLSQQNGTTAERLVEDLCPVMPLAADRPLLIDIITSVARGIISATSGQYFDQNRESEEFFIRLEGGINFDQKIEDYAENMEDWQKDEYFYKFLGQALALDQETYRSGFNIWAHELEWRSHKALREGYVFFGYPNEKSTTHPQQHYYLYFLPIFATIERKLTHSPDEVYFRLKGLSAKFREKVARYGAAMALQAQADTTQKPYYQQKIRVLLEQAQDLFEAEYLQVGEVEYLGKTQPLNGFMLPGAGAGKDQIFAEIAATLLDDHFNNQAPDYPTFSLLTEPLSTQNFGRAIKSALNKIARPDQTDRVGEAILQGLGLWEPGKLGWKNSPYARYLTDLLKAQGIGKVLNRDDILVDRNPLGNQRIYVCKRFALEAELNFIVMATLAALGEVEITLSTGQTIHANQLDLLRQLNATDYWTFSHLKVPKDLNRAVLRALFMGLLGRDLSRQLHDERTYRDLQAEAETIARRSLSVIHAIQSGFRVSGVVLISPEEASNHRIKLTALKGFADELQRYDREARLKQFPYAVEQVQRILGAIPLLKSLEALISKAQTLEKEVNYLLQAKQYLPEGPLLEALNEAVKTLPHQLAGKGQDDDTFLQRVQSLKNQYADFYLKAYLRHRISESDDTRKAALMDSEEKYLCDVLKEADFLQTTAYRDWLESLNGLRKAAPEVNKAAILHLPFHDDFNPKALQGTNPKDIGTLKQELTQILNQWTEALRDILDDPAARKNRSLLDPQDQALLAAFQSDEVSLNRHNVLSMRQAIQQLYHGLDRVDLDPEALKTVFQKPLSPDQALEAFKQYLDRLTTGKERDKVRIVWK